MSDCSLLTPLRRDGTSQRQRMPKALDPCAAPIDGRPTAELLLYAAELARLLRFYTEQNTPKGNWSAFLEHDVSTITARVGAYDADAAKADFEQLRAAAMEPATFADAMPKLIARVFALAPKFDEWRRGSLEGLQLRARLDRVIEGGLGDALRNTIRVAKAANAVPVPVAVTLPSFAAFDAVWGHLDPPADAALFGPPVPLSPDNERAAVKIVALAYERFHETARRLAADAPGFLADTLVNYPQHRPHVALFLAFLRLFNRARHDLNALTASHLDYYYREVLQLVPRGPVADRVHVIFELAKNLPPHKVAKDVLLNAGKDATGVPLFYGTDSEIVVNHASLHPEHGLKTVFVGVGPEPGNIVSNIHAAGDADSDAIAPPIDGEKRWPTFGNATLPFARLGFAIASPMLWLAEGTRTITIAFDLLPTSNVLADRTAAQLEMVQRELKSNVVVEATGPKGWIAATPTTVTVSPDLLQVEYVITIPSSEPAVVGFNKDVHAETFDTTLPMLRFVLKNDGLPGEQLIPPPRSISDYSDEWLDYREDDVVRFEGRFYRAAEDIDGTGFRPTAHPGRWRPIDYTCPYKYFAGMHIARMTVTVGVVGMRNVILESDAGRLNPKKPFKPFGPRPLAGSSFLIGSWEIFQKPLRSIQLDIHWAGLPALQNFKDYYAGYTGAPTGNGHFTVAVEILKDGIWSTAANTELFGSSTTTGVAPQNDLPVSRTLAEGELPRQATLDPISRFEPGLDRGFMRLRLINSFLHEGYSGALAAYAVGQAPTVTQTRNSAGVLTGVTITPAPARQVPNPPYTPTISEFKVRYTASEMINFAPSTRSAVEDRIKQLSERLFHLGPFGYQEFAPVSPAAAIPGVESAKPPVPIFPVKDDDASRIAEGTLYLGIAGLTPPQNLSLLFQMAEGSEDPMLPAQDVQWGYLTASGWQDFTRPEILLDTTNELVASGIVSVAIPKTATSTATILPAGLHWLRATVGRKSGAIPKTVAVLPPAVQASFRDGANDPNHLANPLPAGTIAKLVERDAAIKSLLQPFSSFGARVSESDRAFRIRVAERLRHKRRAVTIFDYERLVLERFPEVYKVRCLSHTGRDPILEKDSEYFPGSVRVVVMPNLRNRNAVDPLRPRLPLSRLQEIRRDLRAIASDFAEIEVVNPDYEEARVRTDVRFKKGFDVGFHTGQLARDIIRFLSPWLYDEGVDLAFGGRVHRSAILNFIEEREYVDFVANFTMDHIIPGVTAADTRTLVDVEEAEPTKSSAVIVPALTHAIGDDIVSCADGPAAAGTST